MRKIYLFILFTLCLSLAFSQVQPDYRYVKTWKVSDRFAVVDSIPVDTMHLNFQDENPIDRLSISNSYNGNLGSPIQSKLYFSRPVAKDFIFANAYYPYLMDIDHATFYNTKTPFSYLNYKTGGTNNRKEDNIKFLFSANVNKKMNIGTTLDYIYAPGEYNQQAVNRFSGSLFGSYTGKHYNATALFASNSLKGQENGGIADISHITDPKGIVTKDIPTSLTAFSNFKHNSVFYNHQYTLGIERPVRISEDSVRLDYVPVTRFAHTLKYNNLSKRYLEKTTEKNFYKNTYHPEIETNDTVTLKTFTNNVSLTMEEEFNKWMNFGLTAFVENEIQQFNFLVDTVLNKKLESNTKIGGILSKQRGKIFRYNIMGEINLLGYKTGDFLLDGNLGGFFKLWNDSISLEAKGFVRSDEPSFFLQNYQSNHFRWSNNFNKTYRTNIGGTFSIPTRSFALNVTVENITKHVYFNAEALPAQFDGNIQVLSANLKQNFRLGKFALENNIVYQVSSQQNILPLPTLALYHNLYFNDQWFKVLKIQVGANVRYHSAYYAPAYMPATGQFHTQSKVKIGNYPVMNVYANLHLKRTRFFVEYFHVNQMFMKNAYFSMPNYPINPAIFKMGLSWNFYD